jgi:hypothetical protein
MVDVELGVMSMGSRGGASVELDEGRMGIDLCRFGFEFEFGVCASAAKGLRRASATEAIAGRNCGGAGDVEVWCVGLRYSSWPASREGEGVFFIIIFFSFYCSGGALAGLALICASILHGQRFQMCLAVKQPHR